MKRWAVVAVLSSSTIAWAAGPATVVRTTDGSVYYGELVEKVEGDHVTIVLATGLQKRFAWKDIDPSPVEAPPSRVLDEPKPGPTATIRTKNGAIYHGEIVEDVPNDHVTLKLATGDLKSIASADIDPSPLPPPQTQPTATPPVENVVTKNGSIYHGEILERVVRDHVTIRLATGEVKTLDWDDIELEPVAAHVAASSQPAATLIFIANKPNAELQHLGETTDTYTTFCKGPCNDLAVIPGTYRVAGDGLQPTSSFTLGRGSNRIEASMLPATLHTAGIAIVLAGIPTLVGGLALAVAAASASSFTTTSCAQYYSCYVPADNTLIDVAAVMTNVLAAALFLGGALLIYSTTSTVTVNQRTIGRVGLDGFHF